MAATVSQAYLDPGVQAEQHLRRSVCKGAHCKTRTALSIFMGK